MHVSEKDFLILRYLAWNCELFAHPDYVRVMKSSGPMTRIIKGRGTMTLKNYIEDDTRPELTQVYSKLNRRWKELAPAFRFRIELLSVPFCRAVEDARDALGRNHEKCLGYLGGKSFKGTLVIPHLNSTISYDLKYNDTGTGFDRRVYLQISDSDCITLFADDESLFVTDTMHLADILTGELAPVDGRDKMQSSLDYLDWLDAFLGTYLCFLHFAEVKEKFIIQAGSRQARKVGRDEDINDTSLPVRRMTVSYFTTTVRTEGFPRKGHFRMQPCKVDGEWTHRLKWIDATYVSGYTRKATKSIDL